MATRDRRVTGALLVAMSTLLLTGGCTGGTGSESSEPATTTDAWAERTGDLLVASLRADGDGPIPQVATPLEVAPPLFDRAGALLALESAGATVEGVEDVDDELAAAIADDGSVSDGAAPVEVLAHYVARLAADPTTAAAQVRERVRSSGAGLDRQIASGASSSTADPFTTIHWVLAATARASRPPTLSVDADGPCAWSLASGSQLPDAAIRASVAVQIADAAAQRCDATVTDAWKSWEPDLGRWLDGLRWSSHLDARSVEGLTAAMQLGAAGFVGPSIAADAKEQLRTRLIDDEVELVPSIVLEAVDAMRLAGDRPALGPETTATLEAMATGSTTVLPQPSAIRTLLWSDALAATGRDPGPVLEERVDWDDPELDDLDRLVVAVAARSTPHLRLAALASAEPGPTTSAIALRALALDGRRCPAVVDDLVARTVSQMERTGAPSASNPFTSSGYAALLLLAERCDRSSTALDDVEAEIRSHLRRLAIGRGLYGPDGEADVRLSATLALAACRIRSSADRPEPTSVETAARGIRLDAGGATSNGGTVISLEETLALAQLDAIARTGCWAALP